MVKIKGFTLIELMIVIAIIAILASILVPNFGKAKEKANLEACKANLKNIITALELYAVDSNGKYPSTDYWPLGASCYLITGGYLKAVPTCPRGNPYGLRGNNGGAYWGHYPGWSVCQVPMVCCWNSASGGNNPHPGLPGTNLPYAWPGGGGVWEN